MVNQLGIALLMVFAPIATAQGAPPGAEALGYSKCVINEKPAAPDIAPGATGNYKWFSGQWFAQPPSLDRYQTIQGALTLALDGEIVSRSRDFSTGKLPALSGSDGFYAEFDVRLSDNDPDHWPAVWLMPVEHNGKQQDHYSGDPVHFERWMELDIDEGGFCTGLAGTVLSWTGIWPHYQRAFNPNHLSPIPLDRTHAHTFGASYDPADAKVNWWVDGANQMSAGLPHVPTIAANQHFYLIISAQSHGKNKPYSMFINGVRAYVPARSILPAAP